MSLRPWAFLRRSHAAPCVSAWAGRQRNPTLKCFSPLGESSQLHYLRTSAALRPKWLDERVIYRLFHRSTPPRGENGGELRWGDPRQDTDHIRLNPTRGP